MARKRTNLIGNTVLIETSWNVKQVVDELAESILRINRNIVECKEIS